MNGYPPPPPGYPPSGPPPPPQSTLGVAALTQVLVAAFLCVIPFVVGPKLKEELGWVIVTVGSLALCGTVCAIVGLATRRREPMPVRTGFLTAALIVGILELLAGPIWSIGACSATGRKASCPHVYAHDGRSYRLDADPLSGALFAGGESDDLDRLEHLAPTAGEYRLRVVNELEEIDHIDRVALLVADHPAGEEVLPTPAGDLVRVAGAAPPLDARDGRGRDVLAQVRRADDDGFVSRAADFAADGAAEPRERLTLRFARPAGDGRVLLVLRTRSTAFAADAFARYLAEMGPGTAWLMRWAQDASHYNYRDRLRDEVERLGLALKVAVKDGERWTPAATVRPIGPAVLRSIAVPLTLPPGDGAVEIRLDTAPLFWELDEARLGPAPSAPVQPLVLRPVAAHGGGRDLTRALAEPDGDRVRLDRGQLVELRFAVPPPADTARTVVLAMRGYYELELGPGVAFNPATMVRHRVGAISLPRYALRLARR
ncbi:MAG TPA: hypothetical protein VGQ83_26440 [Polyangia bacterium]|jgi:hypothetical protein